jgi:hypothetical protein
VYYSNWRNGRRKMNKGKSELKTKNKMVKIIPSTLESTIMQTA